MDNITIGQIAGAMGTIVVIVGFVMAIYKWYKTNFTDKFDAIDDKFEQIDNRLEFVETKRIEYEKEVQNSKSERMILLRGLLAALKGLHEMGCNNAVTHSISEIENYMVEKSHD